MDEGERMSETRVVHVKDNIPGAIYIGRAMPYQGIEGSPFANPFKIGEYTRDQCLVLYQNYLMKTHRLMRSLPELRGKPLACWCRHDGKRVTEKNRCHGDEIVHLLNSLTDEELRTWKELEL